MGGAAGRTKAPAFELKSRRESEIASQEQKYIRGRSACVCLFLSLSVFMQHSRTPHPPVASTLPIWAFGVPVELFQGQRGCRAASSSPLKTSPAARRPVRGFAALLRERHISAARPASMRGSCTPLCAASPAASPLVERWLLLSAGKQAELHARQ